jgi:competence protein ComEA
MKNFSITIAVFFILLSLAIYFTKSYQYEQYALKPKSDRVYKYQVNINLADYRAFDNLPGIGPKLANEIVNDRETRGRFNSVEDIKRVKGIGDKKFVQIKEYLTLEVL